MAVADADFANAVLARRRRHVPLSLLVHALQEFLEFGFLLWSEKRSNLVAALLPRLIRLRIRLVVDRLVLRVQLRKSGVKLLPLIARQIQLLGELIDSLRAPLRLCQRRIRG